MKRQCFAIFLSTLSLLTIIPPTCSQSRPKEVIVIGGGISGLAAARQIMNKGKGSFTVHVYEARRERYGGRIWTNTLKHPKARGLEVDLGGSVLNILNPFTNPLPNLTSDFELETATLRSAQVVVPWKGKQYSGDQLVQAMVQAVAILTDAINVTRVNRQDVSVRQAVDDQLKRKGVAKDSLQSLLLQALPSYVIDEYSALHYQPESLDFGYEQVILGGMGEFVDRLVSGIEDEQPLKVKLRAPVRQVKIDRSEDKVVLRLTDGSQVTADRVIVAVPAPVIAQGTLLFEPGLPAEYQTAVKDVGMSAGNRVIVHFNSSFWSDEHDVYIAAAETDADRGYLQTWLNLHRILGKPVLVGLAVGEAANQLEALSDEDLRLQVLEKLRNVFGKESVADNNIELILRSAWTSDQWAGGASTYPKVGNSPRLWDTFAEPLCPYIFFAGEHTVFRGHGTLHGAYSSGLRAADQLLSGHCEKKSREEARRKREEEKKNKAEQNKKAQKNDTTRNAEDVTKDEVVSEESELQKDEL